MFCEGEGSRRRVQKKTIPERFWEDFCRRRQGRCFALLLGFEMVRSVPVSVLGDLVGSGVADSVTVALAAPVVDNGTARGGKIACEPSR